MIVTVHVVAGGVIGELVGNPAAAFLLGIISHFILDSIPHFDNLDNECFSPRQIAFTAADFMISFSLLFGVIKLPLNQTIFSSVFFWGALGGFFPDLFDNVPFWKERFIATKFGTRYHKFHENLHHGQPAPLIGLSTQLAVVVLFLVIHFATMK